MDRLNRAVDSTDTARDGDAREAAPRPDAEPQGPPGPRPRPGELEALEADGTVHVDVRQDLREGREPFSCIMAARREVPAGGALVVRVL